MLVNHYKLNNFCAIIDNNGLQIDGKVSDVMSPYPIVDKLAAFEAAKQYKDGPTAIVMTTTKGKGVSYMENNAGWHGKAPNDAEREQALSELKARMAELEAL